MKKILLLASFFYCLSVIAQDSTNIQPRNVMAVQNGYTKIENLNAQGLLLTDYNYDLLLAQIYKEYKEKNFSPNSQEIWVKIRNNLCHNNICVFPILDNFSVYIILANSTTLDLNTESNALTLNCAKILNTFRKEKIDINDIQNVHLEKKFKSQIKNNTLALPYFIYLDEEKNTAILYSCDSQKWGVWQNFDQFIEQKMSAINP